MIRILLSQVKELKKTSILTPVFVILEVIMEVIIPLMMASIIDNGVETGNIRHVYLMGGCMIGMAMLSLLFGTLSGRYAARASTGFARNLRNAVFENVQEFSFANIDKYSTAGLVTRMTTDITNVQNAYQMILRMCTRAPIMLIGAMTMAFLVSPRLSVVFLGAIVFLAVILGFVLLKANTAFGQVFKRYDNLNASVQENVNAIRVVKAYVREEYEISKFQKACDSLYRLFVKAEKLLTVNMPAMQLSMYTCIILISWMGAKLIVGGSLTTGQLMSLFTYVINILMSLMMISMVFVMISMSKASAERIVEVLEEQSALVNPEHPVYKVKDGSVEFSSVNFLYKEDSNNDVLSDINFSINSGETIGILGGTGSAKSSLVNLIPRLYDVTGGVVKVGGIDVRAMPFS